MNKRFKEGDKVVVYNRWIDSIKTVGRVTKTQIIINGTKYKRDTGSQIGGSVWSFSKIGVCTKEEEMRITTEINARRMKRYITEYKLDTLSYSELEQIYNILKNSNKE